MAQANIDPNMLDGEISDICDKINLLLKRENDIKANARSDVDIVEKDNLLRRIRVEKRDLNKQLADLSVQKSLMANNVGEVNDELDEQDEEEDADEIGAADTQDLEEENADEYNRLHNLLCRTKGDIKARKEKVENLLKEANDPLLTDSEKRQNDVKIKSQLRSIQEQVNVYKMFNKDIMKICGHNEVETFHENLSEVMDLGNEIACQYEAAKDFERKINDSSNYAFIKNLNIQPYEAIGQDRFIRYKAFIDEFKLYVLSRPLKPLIKLNHLKACLKGDALDVVKNFNHGDQLQDALTALENAYSKPDFVISEIYKNLKSLPSVSSFQNVKAIKTQVQTLKVALATLKTLGFEQDFLGDKNVLQNTFILIELEGRIPMQAYNAWMIEKDVLKASGTSPNLENFTNFYEKMTNQQLDAIYIRKQLEDLNRNTEANSTPGERKQGGVKKDYSGKKRGKTINLLTTSTHEAEKDPKSTTEGSKPIKGKYKKQYCAFEQCFGHATAFCLNGSFDTETKMKIAKTHKLCMLCLRQASHKLEDCPVKTKLCVVCGEMHHRNLHEKDLIMKAIKKKKEEGTYS